MPSEQEPINDPFTPPLQEPGNNKKLQILIAAEKVISAKGFKEATISEIASQAEIKDSVIYRYFKGKEDLLFSIIEERLKESQVWLERDLQGLNDPKSQLRKFIWGNLWYQHAFSAYSRILFFECRPLVRFYSTPAFGLIQKYLGRLVVILKSGVKEGVFRNDLSITLMRDMVMGTLDMITIFFHELKEVEQPLVDFEDAASLIERVLSPKGKPEKTGPDKCSAILQAAEQVFSKKGFDRAKMNEIARQAGVGDGTIYEYFENKDLLLFAIPKRRFEQYRKDLFEAIYPNSAVGKLKKLINFHFGTFLADPDFLRIFVFNLYLNKGFYASEAFETFRNYYQLLEEVIEEGKGAGIFRPEVNARVFRNLLLGTFYHMVTRWQADKKMSDVRIMKEVNQLNDLAAEAVLIPSAQDRPAGPG
jgi:TetR/AcrR family fatty acid metabolism transcriptional regulator